MSPPYRYTIRYSALDGRALGAIAVEPDFEPACAWAEFQGIRRGALPAVVPGEGSDVVPLWDPRDGPPWLAGVRIEPRARPAGASLAAEVSPAFFRPLAEAGSSLLVESGALEAGERYRYRVCAFPSDAPEPPAAGAAGLQFAEERRPLPLVSGSLDGFLTRSTAAAAPDPGDHPVFVHAAVLEQALDMARLSPEVETGGVLLGRLHRSAVPADVFLEITALVLTRHTEATSASFTFTPEAWADARRAVERRGAGELMVGFEHHHPHFCRRCPPARRPRCALRGPFLSQEDRLLQRACFPAPYQVALLVTDRGAGELLTTLYGWRAGLLVERGFHRLETPAAPEPVAA